MTTFKELPKSPYNSYCHTGSVPSVIINNAEELTIQQSIKVLQSLIEIIKKEPLWMDDSNELGNKYTMCNWGLCTEDARVYPYPEMHTFPADFDENKRISKLPLYNNTPCPLRGNSPDGNGCFWSCLAFNLSNKLTSDIAIKRYQETLAMLTEE